VRVITVEELLAGKRPNIPAALMPYTAAKKLAPEDGEQVALFG
jgi:hypothetical protein